MIAYAIIYPLLYCSYKPELTYDGLCCRVYRSANALTEQQPGYVAHEPYGHFPMPRLPLAQQRACAAQPVQPSPVISSAPQTAPDRAQTHHVHQSPTELVK